MVSMGMNEKVKCPECGGWGEICGTTVICGLNYEGVEIDIEAPCPTCDGTGYVDCAECGPEGGPCKECSHRTHKGCPCF
jgi:RecJ-like exonuclease